ncbi:MAG TPA: DUF3459 domain-containing protein, partial [Solirubrobacteraceae bacterium]|nr:DUF3459 domain-containing protein [Solirubrobacteraceae bacterium]
ALLDAPGDVLVFERREEDDRRRVAINFGSDAAPLAADGWEAAVHSDAAAFDGTLAPESGIVLRPTAGAGTGQT